MKRRDDGGSASGVRCAALQAAGCTGPEASQPCGPSCDLYRRSRAAAHAGRAMPRGQTCALYAFPGAAPSPLERLLSLYAALQRRRAAMQALLAEINLCLPPSWVSVERIDWARLVRACVRTA